MTEDGRTPFFSDMPQAWPDEPVNGGVIGGYSGEEEPRIPEDNLSKMAEEAITGQPAAWPDENGVIRAVDESRAAAMCVGAFVQELMRCGVSDFVVSPGSRSTALAMVAFELARVHMDVDERGAAFFALGLGKATGKPAAVICTSGTAPGNWLPAVLEAEASRVPLLLLSADRPPALQGVGAHQTTDQLNLFGNHVKRFYQMPLPTERETEVAYARQVAIDAFAAAQGSVPGAASADAGPVHINFPFEEPLKPAKISSVKADLAATGAFAHDSAVAPVVSSSLTLRAHDASALAGLLAGRKALVLCSEGTCNNAQGAQAVVDFAHRFDLPLLADPLSGMRSTDDAYVIDNYDSIFGHDGTPLPELIIRFGRWPVSKHATTALGECGALQIAVDVRDTRDSQTATATFVRSTPVSFARALSEFGEGNAADAAFTRTWISLNEEAATRIAGVAELPTKDRFEGAYVDKMFELAPEGSLVFSASSMAIRAIDTFYRKSGKALTLLCNRGLSGIDGTLSTAFGAAQAFGQTTVLIGDIAFLHDVNALALQYELFQQAGSGAAGGMPSIVVVVLDNGGGAIFDMLPQKSDEPYFERLFVAPQKFSIEQLAQAFGVTYRRAETVDGFGRLYQTLLRKSGIHIIDVPLPLAGLQERYGQFW